MMMAGARMVLAVCALISGRFDSGRFAVAAACCPARASAECSKWSIHEALVDGATVPMDVAAQVGQLMQRLGLHTAHDLHLLGKTAEAEELMSELSIGGVALGYRAKVRLLLDGVCTPPTGCATAAAKQTQSFEPRRMQSGGGLSSETVAIVLSVLVGTVGYFVQAYTARRAERVASEVAREQHDADAARERLHQQMAAQIKRIDRALDECCRPISVELHDLHMGLSFYVGQVVNELETTMPEVVADMLKLCEKYFVVDANQTISTRSKAVLWHTRAEEFVRVAPIASLGNDGAASTAMNATCSMQLLYEAFALEIPPTIVKFIAADPTSSVARRHRLFVRHSLVPALLRVASVLEVHGAVMPLPPIEFLRSKFTQEKWEYYPPSVFCFFWLLRSRQWGATLADWDAGELSLVVPYGSLLPIAGLQAVVEWAISRSEVRQQDLIGMTTEIEAPTRGFMSEDRRTYYTGSANDI